MTEAYFSGFKFKEFEECKPFVEISPEEIPHLKDSKVIGSIRVINLNDILGAESISNVEIDGIGVDVCDPLKAYHRFGELLKQLDTQIGYPRLTLNRRMIKIVPPAEMCPKTDEDIQWLLKRYGEYAIDGCAGDCTRLANGTFMLRIGLAGEKVSESEAIETIAHEYGHTLSGDIEEPIIEELKAYAFEDYFMRKYHNVVANIYSLLDVSTVHKQALFRLMQLTERGICAESILAHLTGRRFGEYQPNDYRRYC